MSPVIRLCTQPGCPREATYRGRCGEHARPLNRERSPRRRGYGSRWDRIARGVLRAEPLCRTCKGEGKVTAADLVDHIVAKVDGGSDQRENLQPLCRPCHGIKTSAELARRKV